MASRLVFTVGLVSLNLVTFLFYRTQRKLRYLHPVRSGHWMLGINKPSLASVRLLGTHTASGAIWAAGTAVFFCLLFQESQFKNNVPIAFLIVLLLIAKRYGSAAANFGTLISALIFAELLFEPFRSLVVNDIGERANLGWMILGGLVISNFFARPEPPCGSHRSNHSL